MVQFLVHTRLIGSLKSIIAYAAHFNCQKGAIMTSAIEAFWRWWNRLAQKNGKLKFRTYREAAEFVRRVQKENGGPNDKILAMRKRYNEIRRARAANQTRYGESGG
jgi:hypothetical protein